MMQKKELAKRQMHRQRGNSTPHHMQLPIDGKKKKKKWELKMAMLECAEQIALLDDGHRQE